jgi:hypothetical protein
MMDGDVAMKVLPTELATEPGCEQRFRPSVSGFTHPTAPRRAVAHRLVAMPVRRVSHESAKQSSPRNLQGVGLNLVVTGCNDR